MLPGARKIKCSFILWGILLFHLFNNYIWIKLDQRFFTYDSHRYFLASLKIFDAYKNFPQHFWEGFFGAFPFQPPLVGVFTAPFYFIFGASPLAALMLNSGIFLGLLIFSTYKIGKSLIGERAGLLAAFLVTAYPVVFNQLKVYMLDLPLAAVVALSIYLLIASGYFSDLKYSFLFGLSCGAGMLVKQYFPLFIVGPLGYAALQNILHAQAANRKQRAVNLLLSLAAALMICLPYYIKNIPLILFKADIKMTKTWPELVPDSGPYLQVFRSLLWYLWGFINWQASFFYFLLFVAGLVFYFRSKLANKGLIYCWIISSWVLVSYFREAIGFNMEVTGVRYTLPILPAMALITAAGIMQIPAKRIRAGVIAIAVMFGVLQPICGSYPVFKNNIFNQVALTLHLPEKIAKYRLLPDKLVILNLRDWSVSGSEYDSYPANTQDYRVANAGVLRTINETHRPWLSASVFVIPDNTQLWYLQYLAYAAGLPLHIYCDWNLFIIDVNLRKLPIDQAIERLVLGADYIIDKSGGPMGEPNTQYFVEVARYYFNQHQDRFGLLKQIKWPDGAWISVFKKKQPISAGENKEVIENPA